MSEYSATFELSEEEFLEGYGLAAKSSPNYSPILNFIFCNGSLFAVGGTAAAAFFLIASYFDMDDGIAFNLAMWVVAVLSIRVFQSKLSSANKAARQSLLNSPYFDAPLHWTINEQGVVITGAHSAIRHDWPGIHSVLTGPNVIVIQAAGMLFNLPKRAVGKTEQAEALFREMTEWQRAAAV